MAERRGEEEEEEERDVDNTMAKLAIAEYQINKLRRLLAGKLDRSNPVTFSKGFSRHTFYCEGKYYRITIDVDTLETEDKSITRSLMNAIKPPAFIITSALCCIIIYMLAFVAPHCSPAILGAFSDRELETLDSQYSLILDRCAILINDDVRPNPRSFGALYATCNKAIIQLEGLCKEYPIAICEDERIDLYITGNKPRL